MRHGRGQSAAKRVRKGKAVVAIGSQRKADANGVLAPEVTMLVLEAAISASYNEVWRAPSTKCIRSLHHVQLVCQNRSLIG